MYPHHSQGSPLDVINGFIVFISGSLISICFVAGICFVLAGFYQWHEYRKNPSMMPFSQVLTLWILGGALLLIQYLPMTKVV